MKACKLVRNGLGIVLGFFIASVSHGAAPFDPDKQPYGQLPPLTITGFNLVGGTQKTFQVWFDGYNWAGDLIAYPLGADGKTDIATRFWSASDVMLTKQACGNGSTTDAGTAKVDWFDTDRIVVTLTSTGARKAFRWATISDTDKASIGDATNGPKILNYIRGDRSNEKENIVKDGSGTIIQYECGISTGTMRPRTSLIGDILHSNAVYVAVPPGDFVFDDYQAFKNADPPRAPRVYVGANDGMLHAFDALTGAEIWAYIPSMLIPKLKNLAIDPYTHAYFIDGGLVAGDVYDPSGTPGWRTVLVGSLGAGGKGLFGLNITDPHAGSDVNAAMKILWEITPASTGFAELGDTYGDPVIARLNTGAFAAIVGNGYNNAGNGHAVLYVINVMTGGLIAKLDTGAGSAGSPNGLSSPVTIDTNFDGMDDIVYAGDIDGKLWKFDISDPDASKWTAPVSPLYSTGGKAIIGAPDVAAHPLNGYLVYFGTGRLFNDSDAADTSVVNYAYGIWDGAPVANNTILEQTLTEENYGAQRVRVTSGLPINWNDSSDLLTKPLHYGWRTALPAGERVLGTGFVRDARYHFSSINPTVVNTDAPDGENWLNEFDYITGGVGHKLIFDLSGDSLLTDTDRITDVLGVPIPGAAGIPVSIFQGGGLISQPVLAILSAQLSTTIFNSNPFFNPNDKPVAPTPPSLDPGVSGGHFDSDIYSATKKLTHTHEYDDKYDVTGINFLAPSDPAFSISKVVPGTTTKFKILIANQKMSPAVNFSYGGLPYENVTKMALYTTAGLSMASLPEFTRTTVNTLKYNMPKDAFQVKDWAGSGDPRVGLMPTQTGCVNNNGNMGTVGPGPNLLHRNGALTFQVVKSTTPDSVVTLADGAGDPAYGYRVKTADRAAYLLGEWTVFWHHPNKQCFHHAGWVADPPEDLTPSDPKKAQTPAPGSLDPPRDTWGAVTSTVITVIPDPDDSKGEKTIRTTVTTYSSGVKVIVEEWLDKKGKVTKVVVTTVVPTGSGGSGSPPGSGISQALSATNTVTGYQQTRNSGKLGRISWHELLAP